MMKNFLFLLCLLITKQTSVNHSDINFLIGNTFESLSPSSDKYTYLSTSNDYLSRSDSFSTSLITTFDCDHVVYNSSQGSSSPSITKRTDRLFDIGFEDLSSTGDFVYTFNAYDNFNNFTSLFLYRYVGEEYQTFSTASIYEAKKNYYVNRVASDEDLFNLGFSENCNNVTITKSYLDSFFEFQSFVYDGSNDLYDCDYTCYDFFHNNCMSFKGTLVGHRGNNDPFPLRGIKIGLTSDPRLEDRYFEDIAYTDNLGQFELFHNPTLSLNNMSLCIFSITNIFTVRCNPELFHLLVFPLNEFTNGENLTYEFVFSIDLSRNEDVLRAFDVATAAQITADFYNEMENSDLPKVEIVYPNYGGSSFYKKEGNHRTIFLTKSHSSQWDVIDHEVGHCICEYLGACGGGSEAHYYNGDLCEGANDYQTIEKGLQYAYSEGLASALGIMSQLYFSNYFPDVYSYADEKYCDHSSNCDFEVDCSLYGCGFNKYGDGFEFSVTSFILKCFDSIVRAYDSVSFTFQEMWNVLTNSYHNTFSELVYG